MAGEEFAFGGFKEANYAVDLLNNFWAVLVGLDHL